MNLNFKEIRDTYWKYYISFEKQLLETERFVEFDYNTNGNTYSIEFMKLFQAVCSEIDVIGKILAGAMNQSFKPTRKTGINEWWFHVSTAFPYLKEKKYMLREEVELQPWKNYIVIANSNNSGKKFVLDESGSPKGKTPHWWNDYNSAKHNRTGKHGKRKNNYTKANLRNLFIAFSALYSLEVLLMEQAFMDGEKTISVELESRLFVEKLPFYTTLLAIKV